MKNKIICVVGPTASGKTALSIALAKMLDTEIISADSMQIYKDLSIGTAKPTLEETENIPHHLIDILSPNEEFSVAKFSELADTHAEKIIKKGKIPIICGGTGLYLNALIEGNKFENNEKNDEIRKKLWEEYEEKGADFMHEKLAAIDEESAKRIHKNNVKRVLRALEIYMESGYTMTQLNLQNKSKEHKYDPIIIGISPSDRQILYDRIEKRVDVMMENGLLLEAEMVYKLENLSTTAGQAIGYKEFFPYFSGESSLESCVETLKKNTRNYAKRQVTWFGRDKRVNWCYYNKEDEFSDVIHNSTLILTKNGII